MTVPLGHYTVHWATVHFEFTANDDFAFTFPDFQLQAISKFEIVPSSPLC